MCTIHDVPFFLFLSYRSDHVHFSLVGQHWIARKLGQIRERTKEYVHCSFIARTFTCSVSIKDVQDEMRRLNNKRWKNYQDFRFYNINSVALSTKILRLLIMEIGIWNFRRIKLLYYHIWQWKKAPIWHTNKTLWCTPWLSKQ